VIDKCKNTTPELITLKNIEPGASAREVACHLFI